MICPLCGSPAQSIEVINSHHIVKLWNSWGVNVSDLFTAEKLSKCVCNNCGLGFYNPPCPGNDRFYGDLAKWDWYYKHPGKSEYEFTANMLSPGANVIDVGCGIGEFSTYLPVGVNFLGVELSSKSVEIAESLGRNVQQLDITAAPEYLNNSFDVVTCFQVLEHITDIHSFFYSLVSLCKPGGFVVLAVPNNDGFIGGGVNIILNMPPHHVLLWNRQSLDYLAKKYNLEIDSYTEEALADVHKSLAFAIKVKRFINKLLFRPHRTVDVSIVGRVVHRLSTYLANPLCKFYPELIPVGHSLIMVIKRPNT